MIGIYLTTFESCAQSLHHLSCAWVKSRLRSKSGKQRAWARRELKRMGLDGGAE